jgi:hypothetical protein
MASSQRQHSSPNRLEGGWSGCAWGAEGREHTITVTPGRALCLRIARRTRRLGVSFSTSYSVHVEGMSRG